MIFYTSGKKMYMTRDLVLSIEKRGDSKLLHFMSTPSAILKYKLNRRTVHNFFSKRREFSSSSRYSTPRQPNQNEEEKEKEKEKLISEFSRLEEEFYELDREVGSFGEWMKEDDSMFIRTESLQGRTADQSLPEYIDYRDEEKEELLGEKEHVMEKALLDEGDIIKAKPLVAEMVKEVNNHNMETVVTLSNHLSKDEMGRDWGEDLLVSLAAQNREADALKNAWESHHNDDPTDDSDRSPTPGPSSAPSAGPSAGPSTAGPSSSQEPFRQDSSHLEPPYDPFDPFDSGE